MGLYKLILDETDLMIITHSLNKYKPDTEGNIRSRIAELHCKMSTALKEKDDTEIKKLYNSFVNRKEYSS